MSVIVKGMKMPENCMSCPFPSVGVDWYYCYCPGVDGKAYDFEQSKTVPDDCPLIALPDKHGRLVDADAFKADYGMKDDCADCEKEMQGKVRACEYDRIYSKMDFCSWLDDAYTIVEAEGENG